MQKIAYNQVEIDTQWNVNTRRSGVDTTVSPVEIGTQWNVNTSDNIRDKVSGKS